MLTERTHRACLYIARDRDLQGYVFLSQPSHQIRIVRRPNSMPDPFRPNLQSRPNRIRPIRLSRMRCQTQSRVASIPVSLPKQPRRPRPFIPADSKRNCPILHVPRRYPRHLHNMLSAELPNRIQIPENLHARSRASRFLRLPDCQPNFVEIEAAPQNHPRAQRYLRIPDSLNRKPLDHPASNQRIVCRPPQTLRHKLKTPNKTGKIREIPGRANRILRQQWIE